MIPLNVFSAKYYSAECHVAKTLASEESEDGEKKMFSTQIPMLA
jgi:hypothetical protein